MKPSADHSAFPLSRTLVVLTVTALLAFGLATAITPLMHGSAPAVLHATQYSAGVAWVTAMLGVLPVSMLGPLGVLPTVWGYFMGAAMRVVGCLLALMLAVMKLKLAVEPLTTGLMIVYLPLLFVEAGIVGRYLWQKDFPASVSAEASSAPANAAA